MKYHLFVKKEDFISLVFNLVATVKKRMDPTSPNFATRNSLSLSHSHIHSFYLIFFTSTVFAPQAMLPGQYRRFIFHLLRGGDDRSVLLVLKHLCIASIFSAFLADRDFILSFSYYSWKMLSHDNPDIAKTTRAIWKLIWDSKMPYLKELKENFLVPFLSDEKQETEKLSGM